MIQLSQMILIIGGDKAGKGQALVFNVLYLFNIHCVL